MTPTGKKIIIGLSITMAILVILLSYYLIFGNRSNEKFSNRQLCASCGFEGFERRGEVSCPKCGLECNKNQVSDENCETCVCVAPWTGDDCNTCPDGFGGVDCVPNSDCQGQWSEPGECDKECGGGTQTLTYSITKEKEGGGVACEALSNDTKKQDCNTQECPINCEGDWSDYGECDAVCGTGQQTRTYNVKTPAQYNGTACPAENDQSEQRVCESKPCPNCGKNSKLVGDKCICDGNYSDLCKYKEIYNDYSEPYYFMPTVTNPGEALNVKYSDVFPYVKGGTKSGSFTLPNGNVLFPDVGVINSVAQEGKHWVVVGQGNDNGTIAYSCDDGISWYTIDQLDSDNKVIGSGKDAFTGEKFDRVWKSLTSVPNSHTDDQGKYYIWHAIDSTSSDPSASIIYSNDGLNWKRGWAENEQMLSRPLKDLVDDSLNDVMKGRWTNSMPASWSGSSWKMLVNDGSEDILYFLHGFFHDTYKSLDNVVQSNNEYKRPLLSTRQVKEQELNPTPPPRRRVVNTMPEAELVNVDAPDISTATFASEGVFMPGGTPAMIDDDDDDGLDSATASLLSRMGGDIDDDDDEEFDDEDSSTFLDRIAAEDLDDDGFKFAPQLSSIW